VVTRTVAALIDGAVVGVVLVAGYAGIAGLLFMLDPRGFQFPDASLLLSVTAGFVVSVLYLTVAWSISGRTYGNLVMGLRVVSFRGRKLRVAGALVRALFCTVFPIGLLWCAVSPANRSLQDLVLRTSVVYDWAPSGHVAAAAVPE
jgi:uncharacterized RDD family membrane protein YckC